MIRKWQSFTNNAMTAFIPLVFVCLALWLSACSTHVDGPFLPVKQGLYNKTSNILGTDTPVVSGSNIQSVANYIKDHNGTYALLIGENVVSSEPQKFQAPEGGAVTIYFRCLNKELRTISLTAAGSFEIDSGVTLILEDGITFQGYRGNHMGALIVIKEGGSLIMENGAVITGHDSGVSGGGVSVVGGTFTMKGGSISDNFALSGGSGVYVDNGGTFTMLGGEISDCHTNTGGGGGVYVTKEGTFTMSGGSIRGNTAARGGGVTVWGTEDAGGTFTMTGGTISGNTTTRGDGGGIYVHGTFVKTGGTIAADNKAAKNGNAVYAYVTGGKSRIRNSAAGPSVNMDSRVDGRAGGWE